MILKSLRKSFCLVKTEQRAVELLSKTEVLATIESKLKLPSEEHKQRAMTTFGNMPVEDLRDMVKYDIFSCSVKDFVKENPDDQLAKGVGLFEEYVQQIVREDRQDELYEKEGLVIKRQKDDFFLMHGIDYGKFRKYADRDYEIDLKHEMERDLFERQRVVDHLAEENKEKVDALTNYYGGIGQKSIFNKHVYLIYASTFKLWDLTKLQLQHGFSIGCATLGLGLISPYLTLAVVPEMYGFFRASFFLGNVIDKIVLCEDKVSIKVATYGLFGHKRTDYRPFTFPVGTIEYMGTITNEFINVGDFGPSYLIRLLKRRKEARFRKFHVLIIDGLTFYLPADAESKHRDTIEELLLNVMNGDKRALLKFDYSEFEATLESKTKEIVAYLKKRAEMGHDEYYSEEDILKDKFAKYAPNRDFGDRFKRHTLYEPDKADGTYINNNYR